MPNPNVRLFSEILYAELDKVAWTLIDPESFAEIAEECPDSMVFTNDVPEREDSEALAHIIYKALERYESSRASCQTCDNWSC